MESQFSQNEHVAFIAFYFSLGWHNRQKPNNNNSDDDDDDNNDNDDEDGDEQNEPKQKRKIFSQKALLRQGFPSLFNVTTKHSRLGG